MAIGKRKSSLPEGPLFILRVKNKTIDPESKKEVALTPNKFEIREKINDKWTARPQLETQVGGDLIKIEFDKGEWEGNEYDIVRMYLRDEDAKETYMLDLRLTNLSRQLMGCVLALETFENLSVSMYATTSKKDGKTYPNISLWQNDKMIKSRFKLDEIPAPEVIKDKKGVVQKRIFTEVDQFFLEHLKVFAEKVNGKTPKAVTAAPVATNDEPPAGDGKDEDVPF